MIHESPTNTFGKIVPLGTRGALTDSLHLPSFGMDIEHDVRTELPSLYGCWYLWSNQSNI